MGAQIIHYHITGTQGTYLHNQQLVLPIKGVIEKFVPPSNDISMALDDGLRLLVVARHELVLQGGNVLDTFMLKGSQPCG